MRFDIPSRVTVVEVGPRDGLQNEKIPVPTADKAAFITALADAGLTQIETSSFVHPQAVPQLADAAEVLASLPARPGVTYSALVPNTKGYERAKEAGIKRIAVFTAASETFAKRNINMTVAESLEAFAPVVRAARADGVSVRGYLSTCFVCPFEGDINKRRVLEVAQALLDLGVQEVAISDTIGAAVPSDVVETVGFLLQSIPRERIALHFHDTYGTALANVAIGLQLGITTFDASAGGLGGCPFAPGAAGNLATEDLVYMLDRMGIHTGVNVAKVTAAAERMQSLLGRRLPSRQLQRLHRVAEST
ncbi:MAG: hydroxymethylglutaryl-CoA lyase [Phycisphaerales bacterium]|nr:hydroxymethylglutaryl-CoA lyase [Phycisphaerales bacterium]